MRKSQRVAIAIAAVVAAAGVTSILMRHGGNATTSRTTRAQIVAPKIGATSKTIVFPKPNWK